MANLRLDISKTDIPENQMETVYYHLKHVGSITSWDSFTEYGITRLASYISTLRNEFDMNIEREDLTKLNRFKKTVTYGKYTLLKEPKQLEMAYG